MGRIQSSVGLVTGIDIQDTVDKLLALAAQPRDRLTTRQTAAKARQAAVTDLTALVLGVQLGVRRINSSELFQQRAATSSQPGLLTVTAGAAASVGTYQFTPVQQAQNHQLLSSGVASLTEPVGAGVFQVRFGGAVDEAVSLAEINGGEGFTRGKIKLTDRAGESQIIDLRFSQTIGDVVRTINAADEVEISARVVGDRLQLVDGSGGSGNLRVQEVGGGSTASSLGLGGLNVAADSATGQDILSLFSGVRLNSLRDGAGLDLRAGLPELAVTLQDGTTLEIDFRKIGSAAQQATATTTAAGGLNARVKLTAVEDGADFDGVTVAFVDTGAISGGGAAVSYDAQSKVLTVDIEAGASTANDVVAAITADSEISELFSAELDLGSDGSGLIDLADAATLAGGAEVPDANEATLGQLLATINAANPSKLKAEIGPDGDRLVFTDLTSGGGTFAISSAGGGSLAEELGLTGAPSGGQITGDRLQSGLQTTLLSSLNGGQGLGPLGELQLTDRSGATASVDLSEAETLDDVLTAINGAGLGLRAELNPARNGLRIVDATGATASNLIVANGDGTNTAEKLGLEGSVSTTRIDSGALNKQVVSRNTLLADYRGGQGVATGTFLIRDSAGRSGAVNLGQLEAKTIGDVLDAINGLSTQVEARINDTGDGIVLIDQAAGAGVLTVSETSGGRTAKDLGLVGSAAALTIGGSPVNGIDGRTTLSVTLDADDSLTDLVQKINDLNGGFTAGVLSDGSGSLPHRLTLTSGVAGKRGELLVDGGTTGLTFSELAAAQDALVSVGGGNGTLGRIVASTSNQFNDILPGVSVTVLGSSTDPVTATISNTLSGAKTAITTFVEQYNRMRDKLNVYTAFNADANQRGTLFGSGETLRIDADLTRIITGRIFTGGSIRTLAEIGVTINDQGKLAFDQVKFDARAAQDPAGLESFFTDEERGFAARLDAVADTLVGANNSVLINRARTLQLQSDDFGSRIEAITTRLEKQREALLKQFYNLEQIVSRIQNNTSAIQSIQYISPSSS
jgi:flagellar capping protein FliD